VAKLLDLTVGLTLTTAYRSERKLNIRSKAKGLSLYRKIGAGKGLFVSVVS